jgi:hypothetical protein
MQAGSIVITHPNGSQQQLELSEGAVSVGSAPDCDLILTGAEIAPHHALLAYDERGRLVVEIRGENIVGQGGMRLTFNLSQIARPRELAWFGDYVLSYQPATWERQTQPLRLADLPAGDRAQSTAVRRLADETMLLHTLLGHSPSNHSHEAATLAMPLMALAAPPHSGVQ